MTGILVLMTAIIFLFIGRYTVSNQDIENAKEKLKKKPQVYGVDIKTEEELKEEESEDAKVKKGLSDYFKQFIRK